VCVLGGVGDTKGMTLVEPDPCLFVKTNPDDVAIYDDDGMAAYLDPTVLDERMKIIYTHGQCHALAIELSWLLGAPVVVVTDGSEPRTQGELSDSELGDCWRHAVVQVGDNAYLDVLGVHKRSDIKRAWTRHSRLVPSSTDQLSRLHQTRLCMEPNHEVAKIAAITVLEAYRGEVGWKTSALLGKDLAILVDESQPW
jgi:hypothetical protein